MKKEDKPFRTEFVFYPRNIGKSILMQKAIDEKKAAENKEIADLLYTPIKIDKIWIDEAAEIFDTPDMWRDFKKHWMLLVPLAFLTLAILYILFIGAWAAIPYITSL